eukprot:superscaffoldBa00002646_g14903
MSLSRNSEGGIGEVAFLAAASFDAAKLQDREVEEGQLKVTFQPQTDPGVAGAEPRDAHDLTGHEIMCPLSRLQRRHRRAGKSTKSTPKLFSGPRTETGRDTGRAAGRKLVQGRVVVVVLGGAAARLSYSHCLVVVKLETHRRPLLRSAFAPIREADEVNDPCDTEVHKQIHKPIRNTTSVESFSMPSPV